MKSFSVDYFDFSAIIKTKEDASDLLAILIELHTTLFHLKETTAAVLNKFFTYEQKKHLITIMLKNKVDVSNPISLKEFFDFLKTYIEQLPSATLTIAFEPNPEIIETLSQWFFLNLKQLVLLDITVNVDLIGGAVISFKGIYRDCSLAKIVQQQLNIKQTSSIS